ncbi:endonuclease IV [Desulfitobacterium dehalogenans ATCC 51507]|uniref:Endonuclease IV n=1 Tax=Desulfitobacterium dehalogenans (strain ATCC 51507 / DSM 9161 / JW/IU-DC1) TaxID=756499 RepID=I4A838_DESDJ|nr:TIM barrel protein [Desulfitobacterium dehalogenans]AFM00123.1 endonuclease IV [Desulfitobacterium dehalogenans ATCC 51507]
MEKLLFGISGLPLYDGIKRFNYATGIHYLKSIGLDAMELLFVRSVNVTDNNKGAILEAKQKEDFYLSAHASHYINLNSDDAAIQIQSIKRIIDAAKGLAKVGGRSLVLHPGFYMNDSKEVAYATIKSNLMRLSSYGVDYRLETTGKGSQFGTLEELVSLCQEVPSCKLCADFSHIHARSNGGLKNYDDFAGVLKHVLDNLGRTALEDLHIHMGGIKYTAKGERSHVPLLESDFNYKECLRAIKDYDVRGCIIAEGPLLERDALLLKETYEKLV